jgi:putative alpha-1,2-mannosidase
VLGSPVVRRAEIDLGSGRTFRVIAENQSKDNVYVQQVRLDGEPLDRCYILHEEIVRGGELRFVLGDRPNTQRCSASEDRPYSMSAP